ncbi:Cobalt transporter, subunit CbtA [Pseudorhizobium banfieldiae]|uniref:Cobalt transporter, subunit CbtA n=1 Tax=Pseudorhizobium banfieldiae TaxID=1125847 RepID=L0NIC2_9HYPH|nr:CbtA family protein [Pseudorhizobium banfieldiae]CAD6617692.1 cobalt transporter [arsenite-oxidising bacterium NT-25]CCF20840.1 Cobalt transporter, subunit CbtA [Pseudorhizobium banfieldiae]
MSLFRNIVFTAVVAGLLSGLLLTAMQSFSTIPLIMEAETFEGAGDPVAAGEGLSAAQPSVPAALEVEEEAWMPADGAERLIYTAGANMLAGIGFGLVLLSIAEALGGIRGWRRGLLLGIASFVTVSLAPGLGLPPELPGMPAAELGPRQVWWMASVVSTGLALGLLAYTRSAGLAALAIVLLIAPHLVGAPLPVSHDTAVPHELHARFVNAVYATNLVFWAVLGASAALLRERFRSGEDVVVANSDRVAVP